MVCGLWSVAQVSARGLELLEVMPQEWKDDVDRFLFSYGEPTTLFGS
jgi:hypothetical protein